MRIQTMRRLLALVTAFLMLLGLAGCGSSVPEKEVVDLTTMSSTMIFSEVSNIMNTPEEYVGKYIKTVGLFNVYEYNGRNIFTCFIGDAAGCCAQGLEFECAGDLKYPDDYPKPQTIIYVEGTLGTYEEDGVIYSRLNDAKMSLEKE